jgi:hypothetical protein
MNSWISAVVMLLEGFQTKNSCHRLSVVYVNVNKFSISFLAIGSPSHRLVPLYVQVPWFCHCHVVVCYKYHFPVTEYHPPLLVSVAIVGIVYCFFFMTYSWPLFFLCPLDSLEQSLVFGWVCAIGCCLLFQGDYLWYCLIHPRAVLPSAEYLVLCFRWAVLYLASIRP